MRISNRNLIMNQLRNMNTTLANFTNSNNRMTSGRKFDHAYENVADATRAMRLRKSIRDKEFYITNIRDARGRLNSAEDAIQTTVNILRSVTDRVEEALNGTVPEEDRKKIATEISNLQEEVLALMNTTYTDHPVFSGSGYDKKNVAPFQTQGNKLFYHGMNVDQLVYDKKTGTYRKPIYEYVDKQVTDEDGELVYIKDKNNNDVPVYKPSKNPPEREIVGYEKVPVQATDKDGNKLFYDDGKTSSTPVMEENEKASINSITGKPYDIVYIDDAGNKKIVDPNDVIYKTKDGDPKYVSAWNEGTPGTKLLYWPVVDKHGNEVEDIKDIDPTKNYYKCVYEQEQKIKDHEDMDYTSQNYLDIGIGHTFKQNQDGTFSINPETVHQFTYSGIEVFGAGRTDDGMANNVYTFLGEIVDSMNDNDMDRLGKQLNHIKDVRENLLTSITEIGVRSNFLDNMEDIHKNDLLNFQTRQKDVEAVDLPQEAMNNKNHEMAWMVTLQMGSKVLPSSLFDFLR